MADAQDIGAACCVICGNAKFASFDDGVTTYEICPVCCRQSGYEHDMSTGKDALAAMRVSWLGQEGSRWFGGRPSGSDAQKQMTEAGLPIPQRSEAKQEVPQ